MKIIDCLKLLLSPIVFIFILASIFIFYILSFNLINFISPTIFEKYLSNGDYSTDIYFDTSDESVKNFIVDISEAFDVTDANTGQNYAKILIENKDVLEAIIEKNDAYVSYLQKHELSIDNFYLYLEKLYNFDNTMLIACSYIVFLIVAFACVIGLKKRIVFYFVAGIVYMTIAVSQFSDRFSSYMFFDFFNNLAKLFGSEEYNVYSMDVLTSNFIITFKEAMLTFIIFDTILQTFENNKKKLIESELRNIIHAIDIYLMFLCNNYYCAQKYIANIKIINLPKSFKKINRKSNPKLIDDLEKLINSITIDKLPRTNKEYFKILSEIRYLLNEQNV